MAGKNEMTKESQKDTLKRVLTYIKPYRYFVWLSLFFAFVTVVTTLYAPIATGNAIDFIVDKGQVDFTGLKPLLIRFAIVIAITALSQWLMSLCNNKITYEVVKDIRTSVFERIIIFR